LTQKLEKADLLKKLAVLEEQQKINLDLAEKLKEVEEKAKIANIQVQISKK
jgi:hypothetical protein